MALSLVLASTMVLLGTMTAEEKAYADPAPGTPTAVDGRILTPRYSGDTVDWVEIARCGDYSLIIRSSFLNWYSQASRYGDPAWQYAPFAFNGTSSAYGPSRPRAIVNDWFNGNGYDAADKLPANARLREFTMTNSATSVLGTSSGVPSITNGFSHPNTTYASYGNDVAFILSFSETYNFFSLQNDIRGRNPQVQDSDPIARANFNKVGMPSLYGYSMFLRSPGDSLTSSTIGSLLSTGRIFQVTTDPTFNLERGLTYPALWVDSKIFDPDYAYITVEHRDAVTGELLAPADTDKVNVFEVDSYGPYYAESFRFYGPGVLAPYSAPITGAATKNQEVTITYLYTRGEATVIIECRDASRNTIISPVEDEIIPAGNYGPYEHPVLPLYTFDRVSAASAPLAGEIDLGETITIIFLYNRIMV
ncbi:MAG: hypothetical protein FWF91_03340 [Coriobacteriia bacterium]|nr:hypothetical protein [Coriobacteriia bacterium]